MSDAAQRTRAINPRESFCVTAPAGSGKTELLIQRVLALLPTVARPEQILAITFTRKAAAEMRHRISSAIEAARAEEPVTQAHAQTTRDLANAVLQHADRMGWVLNDASFNLRTIDSLCAQLTKQMPVLSGIGGSVQAVDEIDALYEEAVSNLLSSGNDHEALSTAIHRLLLRYDNQWTRVRELLKSLLMRRGDWAKLTASESISAITDALEHTVEDLVSSRLQKALGVFGDLLEPLLHHANTAIENWPENKPCPTAPLALTADVATLQNWRFLAGLLTTSTNTFRKTVTKNEGFPPAVKAEKAAFLEFLGSLTKRKDLLEVILGLKQLPYLGEGSADDIFLHDLSVLLKMLQAHLLLVFQKYQKVDHSHIAIAADLALGTDDAPTDLSMRLDYQIEHILVDEFQDTSDGQFQLLTKLTRGWEEYNVYAEQPRTLFIVGDGMQSIYGFRDANVSLFIEARNHGIGGVSLTPLQLTRNFRSQAGIVNWVNEVFQKLFPVADDPELGRVSHEWADPVREITFEKAVKTKLFYGEDGTEEAAYIGSQIQALRLENPGCSIAVLGRTRRALQPIVTTLNTLAIPVSAKELDPLSGQPVVSDLMSLCRWLFNPADRIAAVALLRSPVCGLKLTSIDQLLDSAHPHAPLLRTLSNGDCVSDLDEQKRIQHLHDCLSWAESRRDRLSLAIWVEQIWLRLMGPSACDDRGLADADRFFELLRESALDNPVNDIDWLQKRVVKLYADHPGSEGAVELMTMHKSKGLEFDHVFIPGLNRGQKSTDRQILRWHTHVSHGTANILLASDDRDSKGSTLYNYLQSLQKQREEAERIRLLYVGATRARETLTLTGEIKFNDDKPAEPSKSSLMGKLAEATDVGIPMNRAPEVSATQEVDIPKLTRLSSSVFAPVDFISAGEEGNQFAVENTNLIERVTGTVVHRMLELLAEIRPLPASITPAQTAVIRHLLKDGGVPSRELNIATERVLLSVNTALSDETGRWILDADNAASELELDHLDEEGGIKTSIMDRLVQDDKSGDWWIIDYKTSTPYDGQSDDEFYTHEAERYSEQLKRYVDLMKRKCGESSVVRSALYFPLLRKLLEINVGK